MYMKATLSKLFFFLTGAILFMAIVAPITQQLFVYATAFATYHSENMQIEPTMPLVYTIFTPFIALLMGTIVGSLWALVLSCIPEIFTKKLLPQAHTKLWYTLGSVLLAMPILLLLFSRVTIWLFDILPSNAYIFVALFWLLCVTCFFLSFIREKLIVKQAERKLKNKWLPICLSIFLIMCVLLSMLFRIYPISSSLDFIIHTKDITDIITEEISLERHRIYLQYSETWIHLIVVAGCAFLLGGWQTFSLRIVHAGWQKTNDIKKVNTLYRIVFKKPKG